MITLVNIVVIVHKFITQLPPSSVPNVTRQAPLETPLLETLHPPLTPITDRCKPACGPNRTKHRALKDLLIRVVTRENASWPTISIIVLHRPVLEALLPKFVIASETARLLGSASGTVALIAILS